MDIRDDVSLAPFNTLRLNVSASRFVAAKSREDVRSAVRFARANGLPLHVLGAGSNVVFTGDLPGLTLRVELPGRALDGPRLKAAAGEDWDDLVQYAVDRDAFGLENLSAIPGTVGAAPVQNIGAYGVQLSDRFESLEAYDMETDRFVRLDGAACEFGYRDSIFKSPERQRFVICEVTLNVTSTFDPELSYPGVAERAGDNPDARGVRQAIKELRAQKLPDPTATPNVGSFFKNPVVGSNVAAALRGAHVDLPAWRTDTGEKLAAAWLIERAGCKGLAVGGAAVSEHHALVFINRGGATPADVDGLTFEVRARVRDAFGVELEREPDRFP